MADGAKAAWSARTAATRANRVRECCPRSISSCRSGNRAPYVRPVVRQHGVGRCQQTKPRRPAPRRIRRSCCRRGRRRLLAGGMGLVQRQHGGKPSRRLRHRSFRHEQIRRQRTPGSEESSGTFDVITAIDFLLDAHVERTAFLRPGQRPDDFLHSGRIGARRICQSAVVLTGRMEPSASAEQRRFVRGRRADSGRGERRCRETGDGKSTS